MAEARFPTSYLTSGGAPFDLGGGSGLLLNPTDAPSWEFEASGHSFVRKARDISAELTAIGAEAMAECDRLLAGCAADLEAGTPGTLTVGEWSLACYLRRGTTKGLTSGWQGWGVDLYAPDPTWTREHRFEFLPHEGSEGIDLPYDLPYDLPSGRADRIESPALGASDFRLTIYGAATNPSVTIGGNAYGATVDVPARARLVIDSTRKRSMAGDSVCLVDEWGVSTDAFDRRIRGAEGSGSYVFERVPAGVSEVSRSGNFGFDLTLYERRARLPWT